MLPMEPSQARALGTPTRQEIMRFLADAGRPVTVAELSQHLGLNHNGVRKHLAHLVSAGLVDENREIRTSPGRPKLLYRLSPGTLVARHASYERLSALLAEVMASGDDPVEVGRRFARQSRRGALVPGTSALDGFLGCLAADGFDPVVESRNRGVEIDLGRCPFEAAVEVNPAAVCGIHRGLAEGTAEVIGVLRIEGLARRGRRRAACRLTVAEVPCASE